MIDRSTRLLGSDFDKHHLRRRRRDIFTVLNHRRDVQFDCLVDVGRDFFDGVARRNATREVGNVRAEIRSGILNNDRILAQRDLRSRPACLTMLAIVDFESSIPNAPGTVTDPFFSACRKMR